MTQPHGYNAEWRNINKQRKAALKTCKTASQRAVVNNRYDNAERSLIAKMKRGAKAKNPNRRGKVPRWRKGIPFATWYPIYLRSPHWQRTRKLALKRAGHRCESCKATGPLEVHHLTYVRLRQELPEDLRVLCRDCHADVHGIEHGDSITVEYLRLDLGNNSCPQ